MTQTIRISKNEAAIFAQVCYELTVKGTAYSAELVGDDFVIEITGY